MQCNPCEGTGFTNTEGFDENFLGQDVDDILRWIQEHPEENLVVCDCCGNGNDDWHGVPGQHYDGHDKAGPYGPYAYNGGLPACAQARAIAAEARREG